jgi:hypothetical protein
MCFMYVEHVFKEMKDIKMLNLRELLKIKSILSEVRIC